MIDDSDLTAIFASGDFDTAAVFTIAGPSTVTVRGWFTDSQQNLNMITNEVEAVNPSFLCKTSAITGVKRGNSVVINAVTYTAERIERTGVGTTFIHLKT